MKKYRRRQAFRVARHEKVAGGGFAVVLANLRDELNPLEAIS